MALIPPNWDTWRHIPKVELWEAVALSLNIEPRQNGLIRSHSWMAGPGRRAFTAGKEFDDRLFTVERALSDYYVGGILLPAFVKWATGAQWELPMELPEIAEDQGRTAAPTPDEETPATNPNKSDKLAYLNQAALIFWGKADKNSRTAHPNNAAVEVWLRDKGFSVRLAQSGASIIRPEWAGTGRKPENSDAA
ncbi:MAG TPA: hypothetical protein VI457_10895 [Methylococcaceae bacterium]|nr:hypothetical protein [Methylococcaceae bacterium]